MRRASLLVTNSRFSLEEAERTAGVEPARATVVHHGVPDRFGEPIDDARERLALTVGVVEGRNLERKGLRPFVAAAARLPDVSFALVGRWEDDAIDQLRRLAPENVRFTGWVDQEALDEWYRRAAVYVQPSRHEGFGMSVAEAMLAGCVPVVMNVTAMPEVVGDAGVLIESQQPEAVAEGVRRALDLGPDAAQRARERILTAFPMERRHDGILGVVEDALHG
jgi:glycosyltransferase involved in cell wall biosynthesis